MDFIARAGSVVDKGHRVIGLLIVVIVLEFFWILMINSEKGFLQERINIQNNTQSIYVVPNSQAGIYRPAEGHLLLTTFVDYISQNLMTYTPVTMEKQYKDIRDFLSPNVKAEADASFKREFHKSKIEEISSIFVADRTSTQLRDFKELREKRTIYGKKTYEISLKGIRSFVVAGRVLSSKPVKFVIQLQETNVTEENPFGFIVTNFKEDKEGA